VTPLRPPPLPSLDSTHRDQSVSLEHIERLEQLARQITDCRQCPRIVAYRERVAREKRAMYRNESYWGKPVPGFGDPLARIVLVGLAPAAHGANRTGRIFTGDRSGDFLYAALHRAGLASQPESRSKNDGLVLRGAFVTCPVRCAPPDNRPDPAEIAACAPFLDRELALLPHATVLIALGNLAHRSCLAHAERRAIPLPHPRPAFAHGAEIRLGSYHLLSSYHVSQQNTQTGKLTPPMFDQILTRAKGLAHL
jgi:uracil-DNA glycosylase